LLLNVTGAGLWLSGGLWLIYRYFLRTPGEFGPEPAVLEVWWLILHGAFAFLALWTLGFLWGGHIVRGWATGRRRWSGGLLFVGLMFLTITGYLALYAVDDGVWTLLATSHWVFGLALPLGYFTHRWFRKPPAG